MLPNRKVPDIFKDVLEFLQISAPQRITKLGGRPGLETLKLAKHLINEEINKELMPNLEAMIDETASMERMVQFLDDALDSMWVLAWSIHCMSLPGNAGWNELKRANMSKFPLMKDNPNGVLPLEIPEYFEEDGVTYIPFNINQMGDRWVLTNAATGKVMKPKGFTPPDMFEVVHGMITIDAVRNQHDIIATPFMKEYFHEMEERFDKGEVSL